MNEKPKRQKSVVLFSSPACVWCVRAKEYLRKNKIRFNIIDVSKDKKAAEDCKRHTGNGGVPVVLIGSRWISGFNQKEIDKELGL
jgi:glutaredoxin 3